MISNQPHSDQPGGAREHEQGSGIEQAGGRMKEHLRSVADDAKEKGRSVIDRQKHQLAETLRHVCQALHSASKKLHEEHDDTVANYADAVSERLDDAADYVDRVDVSEIIDNVEGFARRQPHIFLGGMFLVGLAAARFLKASPPSSGNRSLQSGGGMQMASSRQQSIGASASTSPIVARPQGMPGGTQSMSQSRPGQGGPSVTPPTGATFPSSSEPIPGPRRAEPSGSQGGIGGTSRSQENRPGSQPGRGEQGRSEHEKREVDR